jgi:hypothetical protein
MPSDAELVLKRVDWVRYGEEAELAVADAVRHYAAGRKGSRQKPVRQIAVWTDPGSLTTCVNFETLEHAISRGGMFIRGGPLDQPRVELSDWADPSDFEFRYYHCVFNSSLTPLGALDVSDDEVRAVVLQEIERALLGAQQRVVDGRVLDPLPRTELLAFGINSPRGWWDHVIEFRTEAANAAG